MRNLIVVLMGGLSGERKISFLTGKACSKALKKKGYKLQFRSKTSGPINAIYFDNINKTFQGGSSDFGEDYGIAW